MISKKDSCNTQFIKNNILHEGKEIEMCEFNICISTFICTLLLVVGLLTNHFIEAIIYEVVVF